MVTFEVLIVFASLCFGVLLIRDGVDQIYMKAGPRAAPWIRSGFIVIAFGYVLLGIGVYTTSVLIAKFGF